MPSKALGTLRRLALGPLLLLGAGACDEPPHSSADSQYAIPALRFAGVDLVYALRRVAGEAGLLLVLDEIRPDGATAQDLGFERVDTDLEPGPAERALETLRRASEGAFHYRIEEGLLIVRSIASLDEQTFLDREILPAASIEVDFNGMVDWIMARAPDALLLRGARRGQPVFKRVALDIPERSSVMDVFLIYARAVESGLRIRRAGYPLPDGRRDLVVANTVGLWESLRDPVPVPDIRQAPSIIYALAQVAERNPGVVLCVFDRSILMDNRGTLNFTSKVDRGLPLEQALSAIADQGTNHPADFRWLREDGVIKVQARMYGSLQTGRGLMAEKLHGGRFRGSLGGLVRWLNANRMLPSPKLLLGGEVVPGAELAEIEMADGSTVEQALTQFALATGQGIVVVVKDSPTQAEPLRGTWSGAWVSRLVEWGPSGRPPRY